MLISTKIHRLVLTAILLSGFATAVRADLVLETETAELGNKGDWLFSQAVQFERDRDGGHTQFTLNQYEYAVSDRGEILVEPFFYEWDQPKGEKHFSGVGDLEITPSYMVVLEKEYVPAVVLAFKLKVPTATNRDIGTGKFDYQPYIILGKKIGPWIFNMNLDYNFVTSPKDEPLKNQFIYDFSVERQMTKKWSVFAEIFGNTSPAEGEKSTFAGAIATEYHFTPHFNAFVSVGYDSDKLFNIRPGFNIEY